MHRVDKRRVVGDAEAAKRRLVSRAARAAVAAGHFIIEVADARMPESGEVPHGGEGGLGVVHIHAVEAVEIHIVVHHDDGHGDVVQVGVVRLLHLGCEQDDAAERLVAHKVEDLADVVLAEHGHHEVVAEQAGLLFDRVDDRGDEARVAVDEVGVAAVLQNRMLFCCTSGLW